MRSAGPSRPSRSPRSCSGPRPCPDPGSRARPSPTGSRTCPARRRKLWRFRPISSPLSRTKTVSSVALPSVPGAARTSTTRCGVSCAGYAGTAVEKNAPVMSIRVAGPSTWRKSMASTKRAATISMAADLTRRARACSVETRTTSTVRGPCTPSVVIISRSPVRLGPPIHVSALGRSPAAIVCMASASVGTRSATRNTQMCSGGTRLVPRGEPGAAASAIAAGSATARSAPVMPASASASRTGHCGSRGSSTSTASRRKGVGQSGDRDVVVARDERVPGDAVRRSRRAPSSTSIGPDTVQVFARSGRDERVDHRCSLAQRSRNGSRAGRGSSRLDVHARNPGTRPRDTRPSAVVSRYPRGVDHARAHTRPEHAAPAAQRGVRVGDVGAQREDHVAERDLHRARVAARVAQRRAVRKIGALGAAGQQRREHLAHRPRVHRVVRVAAHVAVHGAHVQARAAPDAREHLLVLRAEQRAAPVVEEHDVQLVGTVDLARAARPADHRHVVRQRLAGRVASSATGAGSRRRRGAGSPSRPASPRCARVAPSCRSDRCLRS